MEPVWYYVRDGVQTGPMSFEELQAAAVGGAFAPTDLVWQEGTPDWVAAEMVYGLFDGPRPAALPSRPALAPVPAAPAKRPEPLHPAPARAGRTPGRAGEILQLALLFLRRAAEPNPATIAPTPDEEDRLTQAGVADPTARKYAVWRRAVLWVAAVPTAFAALFGFVNAIATDTEFLSGFGILVLYLEALVFFLLPASAVIAARAYDRPGESARWVMLGGAVTVGFPVLVAFIPAGWLFSSSLTEAFRGGLGVVHGLFAYLILMPTVLALLPAVSRACVRVKAFLPQSLVPGWGLVASVPLFVLLTLATFVLVYQAVGNLLLVVGLVMWIGAPLLYLTRFSLLTRPLTSKRDLDTLTRTQTGVLALITGGVIFVILFLFDAKVIGTDDATSAVRPWSLDVHEVWIEYLGRSLFLTVLFADLLVRMAMAVWREEKEFVTGGEAAAFDDTVTSLAASLERPGR